LLTLVAAAVRRDRLMHAGPMKEMMLRAAGTPLVRAEVDRPVPGAGQGLLRVRACGLCRTDLHVVDGELTRPKLPLVPGHQIVGIAEDGRRLGVPWLGWTCGECRYCQTGKENLCNLARFTGYEIDGGYAEWTVADERFPLPASRWLRRPRDRAAALRRTRKSRASPRLRVVRRSR
jgi:propanol-preferring alcohol dehydrogenase